MRGRDVDTTKKPPRVPFPWWVLWLFLLLGLVTTGAVFWGVSHVESDLTVRSEAALAAAGIDLEVTFDGRDAQIRGSVTGEAERAFALQLVGDLAGVRAADASQVTVVAADVPAAPAAPSSSVEITIDIIGGLATVTGSVRDQRDADAIASSLVTSYGPTAVVAQISVSPDVGPAPWLVNLPGVLSRMGTLRDGAIRVVEGSVVVEGIVATEIARTNLIGTLSELGFNVEGDLFVGTLGAPSVLVERSVDGGVVVNGLFPDQAAATAFLTEAVNAYGANVVRDETAIGLVEHPAYLAEAAVLVGATTTLETWSISIEDGVLSVVGFAGDADGLAAAESAFSNLEVEGLDLGPQLELSARAVGAALTELFAGVEVFAPSGADITPEAQDLVDRAVEVMAANPSAMLTVEGHTDSVGDAEINRILSQARAEAIVVYLVSSGVEASRLKAIGVGEDEPIASNATPEGRAMNRRIEFVPQGSG